MNYYNKSGQKISLEEWIKLLEDDNYRLIKQVNIGEVRISFIWIGLQDLMYEIMIFGGDRDSESYRPDTIDKGWEIFTRLWEEHKLLQTKNETEVSDN